MVRRIISRLFDRRSSESSGGLSIKRPSARFSGFARRERPQKAFDAKVDRDPVGLVSGIDAVATQKGVKGAGAEVDWRCVTDGDRADDPDALRSEA
jgi:hypothetical protein